MVKILFKHPEMRKYRKPFFDLINKKEVDIYFLFNRKPIEEDSNYSNSTVIGSTTKKSMWMDVQARSKFVKKMMSPDYEIFITSNPTASTTIAGVLISKIRGKKILLWDEGWLPYPNTIKGIIRHYLNQAIFNLSDAFFASGTKVLHKYTRYAKGVTAKKIFFAPQCSLDLSTFPPSYLYCKIPKDHTVFLFFARMIDMKGLDLFIQAYAEIQKKWPDTFLLIVGDGDEREKCEKLAKDLDIQKYFFHGAIPDNDENKKAAVYSISDVVVLPSRIIDQQCEGWGLVINEALSMGKPVIVTDAVGCSDDLVENGKNGYVVKHSSVKSLQWGMEEMLKKRMNITEMGQRSREIFDNKNSYQRMAEVFSQAINFAYRKE